mmetsp:Transcript_22717/g.52731  ORF Transcript_22717/g.52731 Transcript_22717/m.52731 type:complete len:337 (+) Transcript_22717:1002-2012(+)
MTHPGRTTCRTAPSPSSRSFALCSKCPNRRFHPSLAGTGIRPGTALSRLPPLLCSRSRPRPRPRLQPPQCHPCPPPPPPPPLPLAFGRLAERCCPRHRLRLRLRPRRVPYRTRRQNCPLRHRRMRPLRHYRRRIRHTRHASRDHIRRVRIHRRIRRANHPPIRHYRPPHCCSRSHSHGHCCRRYRRRRALHRPVASTLCLWGRRAVRSPPAPIAAARRCDPRSQSERAPPCLLSSCAPSMPPSPVPPAPSLSPAWLRPFPQPRAAHAVYSRSFHRAPPAPWRPFGRRWPWLERQLLVSRSGLPPASTPPQPQPHTYRSSWPPHRSHRNNLLHRRRL